MTARQTLFSGSRKHRRFLRLAAKRAQQAPGVGTHRFRVGAVVVQGRRVVSWGYNQKKTHPGTQNRYRMVHAETDAVQGIFDVSGATLYIVRVTTTGKWSSSRPCTSCWDHLVARGVTTVIYTDAVGRMHKERVWP